MVCNVFQLSFKLKGSIRGKLFSIIWDTECCLLVSSQHLVTIRKSLWLPFRFSDYKTRRQPPNKFHIMCILTLFIRKMQSWWEVIIIKMPCQSFISTGYHTTSCILPLPSFQELNSNPRLFTMSQYLFYIKISQVHVHLKHFRHRKLMFSWFWSFTRPFRIPCSTW